jgi:hypothetical protein
MSPACWPVSSLQQGVKTGLTHRSRSWAKSWRLPSFGRRLTFQANSFHGDGFPR